jgi:acetyltransferase-like isoleucine patch superfamily enzyme
MSLGGILVSLFPAAYLLALLAWVAKMFMQPSPFDVPALIAFVYLIPLACFRLHSLFLPLRDGDYDLSQKKYNVWWASHMFQYPFIALPMLEGFIHFIPGLFSIWLRAWGAKVGNRVHWTPKVEIVDRGLIEVGDGVIIGHLTAMCSHMVATQEGKPILTIKTITIGARALIGAVTQLGPGASIAPGEKVKPKSAIYWRGEWT